MDYKNEDEDIQEAFNIFDKDKGGTIEANELAQVFRSLGYNYTQQEIEKQLKEIDKSFQQHLNIDDFRNLLKKQEQKLKDGQDELFEAFRIFDRDGNGKITSEELKHVFQSIGENLSDQDIDDMIKHASNGRSFVSFKDFYEIYQKNIP